jgi:hypothetical protein
MKDYKYLPIITGIFTATLLISNTLDTKLFIVGPMTLTGGLLLFPLAYLFGDVLTEVYGYAASRKVIWTGFSAMLLMAGMYEIVRIIEPAPFWEHQKDYENILGKVPRIVLASIVAYFAGEFVNSYVVAKMKLKTKGKGMAIRFVVSTFAGQAVDTVIFVAIAFVGIFSFSALGEIILWGWLFKVVWEIIALPLTVRVVGWLKKVENVDYYDADTNFNPFNFSSDEKEQQSRD